MREFTLANGCIKTLHACFELFVQRSHSGRREVTASRIQFPEGLVMKLEDEVRDAFLRAPDTFDARGYGGAWLKERRSCVLEVPSRIVPEEATYLINPPYPDFSRVTATTDPYHAAPRLF